MKATLPLIALCAWAAAAPAAPPAPTPLRLPSLTPAAAPARVPAFAEMNTALGIPLWQDDALWDDTDAAVATRLSWPQESRTTTQSSFRLYARDDARVLGCRPYSLAFWAAKGKPTEFSMIFANKGDRSSAAEMEQDAAAIERAFKSALGDPVAARFGQGSETRTKAHRWNWKGHALLLEVPRDNYVGVRIVPAAIADKEGRIERVSDVELRQLLGQRVKRRDNGDVVVTDIPMVDQGPKGYCVPATWERYLRYLGIPADMYVLAMAGQTKAGGGTYAGLMAENVQSLVSRYGRKLSRVDAELKIMSLARYIDKGLPLMWGVFVEKDLYKELSTRAVERRKVTDWNGWIEQLKPKRKAAKQISVSPMNAHLCMIIGYNGRTKEVATSDSWGKEFEERWLTLEEAAALSQPGEFWEVKW
ncbi:MAG: C39 family peptidase [Verrucomicrobia bacterium]|nr:C39 family peptidase [Verrucomicrobiota bacterium]